MDDRTERFIDSFQAFLDDVLPLARQGRDPDRPRLADVVSDHLGVAADSLAVVRLDVPGHQFVNLDVAIEALVHRHGGGRIVGIGGGDQRHHQTLGDLLAVHGNWGIPVGAVDRARLQTGPDSTREAIALGVHLFRYDDVPVALLQRRANRQYGETNAVELVAAADVSEALLADLRALMVERSVFRGKVLTFDLTESMYGASEGGISFLARPALVAEQVVLPVGTLARIERHVAGPVRHRAALRDAGQHLKRGLLLYGPPGTGKTHTVRFLISQLPEVTCVLLSGNALSLVTAATELARALQPAVIVVEDVDLIAEHRELHGGPQPLLFTLLDAMDGLTADADVAFVLTTNRADLLEDALSQRPGRVDLAVEVPTPDETARRALLDLYTADLPISTEAREAAAQRSGGVTASFFKELARRTVLLAAEAGRRVDDQHLADSLDEMLADSEQLTRALLGGASGPGSPPVPPGVFRAVPVGPTPTVMPPFV